MPREKSSPKNVVDVYPKCCWTCIDLIRGERPICDRDQEEFIVQFDGENIYTQVCDRYKRA